jgi:transposase-like protein
MSTRQHRTYSTEFKLQVVKAHLDGEGSLKALARRYEITHTLILFWLDKHRRGALTAEDNLEEKVRDSDAKIAALERKVGQLTMELDLLKKLAPTSALQSGGKLSIVSGPVDLAPVKDAKP